MGRARGRGYLSPKTFFPKTGDLLISTEEEQTWECARANSYVDRYGVKHKYALLVCHVSEAELVSLITLHSQMDLTQWLPDYGIDRIKRKKSAQEDYTVYEATDSGSYSEVV